MESQNDQQNSVNQIYTYAANLMVEGGKKPDEVKLALKAEGLDQESATVVVSNLEKQIQIAKIKRANRDMLFGALWCIGGIVATAAEIGYIFWGAILFGGLQFFKGLFRL